MRNRVEKYRKADGRGKREKRRKERKIGNFGVGSMGEERKLRARVRITSRREI